VNEEREAKLEHLQETQRHQEVRVRALKRELRFVAAEITRLAELQLGPAVVALRSDLDLLREELLAAETPLSTVRAPGRRPEPGEVEGG
jgi:hypothetical protein